MSSKVSAVLATAAFLFARANAHGFVSGVVADGKYYVGQSHYSKDSSAGWLANNGDNGFARSMTDASIICHNDAVSGKEYITIAAGNSMEIQWNTWPESHHGPMLDYLAPCGNDCTTIEPTSLKFTKIDEAGLIDGSIQPGKWASDDMIANNNSWITTIPSTIAPGKYVLRHETIALHSAGSVGGAQAYPQCLNIEVTGSGTNSLSGGIPGMSLYKSDDPGVLINIYQSLKGYTIPGPSVMAGGSSDPGNGSGNGGASSASTKPVATSSATRGNGGNSGNSGSAAVTKTSSIAVTARPTTANNVVSTTTGSSIVATATAGGRKFVCYEEL